MANSYDENEDPERLQGKYEAIVVSCILGMGSLVSWNCLLTVGDYYYQVFPDYHPSRVLTLIYQPFGVGTIMILAFYESRINTRKRNLIGYITFTISTFLLIVLDLTTKGHGGIGPYVGICVIAALFGIADATVRGGMIGDLSLMCPEFIQSFTAGMAVAGALTSAFRLITKAAFEKSHDGLRKGALIFLAISTFVELLCVLLYAYVFPNLPIVKYYRRKAASEGCKTVSGDLTAVGIQNQSALVISESYRRKAASEGSKTVSAVGIQNQSVLTTNDDPNNPKLVKKRGLLLQNIDYATNLFLIYALTVSIMPGFLYENTGKHSLGTWYALVLIAMYNWWDLIGRYAPLVKLLKIENRRGLTCAALLRFFFIPAFYFTAKYGDQGWMIMLVSVLGLTNGHLTVCILTIAPRGFKGPEKNALGNLLVIFVLGGALVGASLGWLWIIGNENASYF